MSRCFIMVLLATSFAMNGCNKPARESAPGKVTSEEVTRDAGQALKSATQFSEQKKEEFQKALDNRLKELDSEIAKLEEKGRDLQDSTKSNWDKTMADLKAKREVARGKLDEVTRSSADAWKDVQKGAQAAWDDLDRAFKDAAEKF